MCTSSDTWQWPWECYETTTVTGDSVYFSDNDIDEGLCAESLDYRYERQKKKPMTKGACVQTSNAK